MAVATAAQMPLARRHAAASLEVPLMEVSLATSDHRLAARKVPQVTATRPANARGSSGGGAGWGAGLGAVVGVEAGGRGCG